VSPRELLLALLRASLEGGALILFLWSVTRLWPRMPIAARRWLWWLGGLRLLLGLAPIPRLAMSVQAALDRAAAAVPAASERVVAASTALNDAIAAPLAASQQVVASRAGLWMLVLLGLWAAGALLSLALLVRRIAELERRWRAARPFTDPRARRWQAEWAFVLGASRTPEIRVGGDTRVPLAVGMRRTGILLPEGSERWSDDALRLVLAHELSHLRRRDPLLGWIPALAEMLFWFHPLARLSSREYLAAREELCDADALRATSASPRDYGELLLGFAVGRGSVLPGSASCGTPAGRRLKRRLEMLSNHGSITRWQRLGAAVFAALFVLIGFSPVRLLAHESTGYAKSSGVEMHGSQSVSDRPTPIAYMLKTAGKPGTRGSIDLPFDMAAAHDLDRWNRTALYLRLANERWMIYDDQAIAEVRKVLAEEDQWDVRQQENEKMSQALEREEQSLEARSDKLQSRKEALDDHKSELEDKRQDLASEGKSTKWVDDEIAKVKWQIEQLSEPLEQDARARADLHQRQKDFEAQEKRLDEERDAAEQRTLAKIDRIGRHAIDHGLAESYDSGGASEEQPRSGTFRFFLPPAGQIW
jgi:beta-lactamase regulating signal transducer with metallopeptidase domain